MTNLSERISGEPYLDSRSTLLVTCSTIALSYLVPNVVRMLSSIVRFIPGNTVEVLISAVGLRYCFNGVPRLNSVKALAKYAFFAIVLAPFAGAFLSAQGIARDYWTGWKIVFLSEVLAFVTVTPALLSWVSEGRVLMRRSRAHHLEGLILIAGLALVSYIVFTVREDTGSPALFYTLVPFLLWSALRFGWLGVSTSLVTVTSLSIWGAVHGRGPFSAMVPLTDPLPLQMFLVFATIPFMVLAALAEEREQGAQVLRESEERFRLVANTAPVMIWMAGTDRLCTYVNQAWLEFTGRPLEAELGNGWVEGVHKEDLKGCLKTYSEAFGDRQSFEMEYRVRRNDGEYRWILDTGVPRFNPGGSFAGYIGSCLDITDRKLAEEALASVGHRLMEAHEEERRWIARELHDDIVQRVALLAAKLEESNQLGVDHRIREACHGLSKLATDIQALSHRLHSSMLEYLGLVAAARSFCRELSEQRNVRIEFKHSDVPSAVPKDISLCLFRVLQEALQNAVRHSGGQDFAVEVHNTEDGFRLIVSDSGIGFDWRDAINHRGLGLVSMRERLRLVNGELAIHSEPGHGTTILARVPRRQEDRSIAITG